MSRHPAHHCQWSQCQWSPAGAGKHGDEGAGVTRTEHEGARTAAHSRPPTTINCCSIHCYNQWESCNRNQGPTLQCCMSCSAAVTRDTTVKSAQARHNLQVSSHHSFSQNCEAHGWDSHNAVTQCMRTLVCVTSPLIYPHVAEQRMMEMDADADLFVVRE